jgi:hypothetical protein
VDQNIPRARIIVSGRVFYSAPAASLRAMLRGRWRAARRRTERAAVERRIAAAFGRTIAPQEVQRIARAAFGWRELARAPWTRVDVVLPASLPTELIAIRSLFDGLLRSALPGVRIDTQAAPADGGSFAPTAAAPARIVHEGIDTFRIEILEGPAMPRDFDDFLGDVPAQYDWFSGA